ncbi:MAG: NAD(+)/NADH kinase [Methanothrix sp.]|uniref:NAD(+)/NADH kinase n=1 Tax=Methanothrix sp. TaxID=90426 RepID=UPI0025D6225A|nr:NAD(+)/NADH kinase [Methanothrix sp.]MBK7385932.1 NAD(+)/NADH kinase [Methanothrix sp.]MDI9416813.1 NAD(+)/NADH kinase [Euryarchaeota archaeon]HON35808.1 NAD(+)/NADH kinase [Methanothrix sp.]HRU76098.1 NAD(+)/NADH kinase [Methanothrix sp.]
MIEIKIGFVSRRGEGPVSLAAKLIQEIESWKEGVGILVDEDLAVKIGRPPSSVQEMEQGRVDFIVSIGGDGTILRTIHKMADPVPILGINMGTLGFLVDVEPADAETTIKRLLSGFVVDERSRLKMLINGVCMPRATNEIALITASPAKMIEFEILVDGSLMEDFRADGVIIATATGSTAYAMSAGGPIVDPRVDAIVLVPMAPFKLSSRPWVMPGGSVIEVRLKLPEKEALVVVDGQSSTSVSSQDRIVISKAKTPARFVKVAEGGFYAKVKSKLT